MSVLERPKNVRRTMLSAKIAKGHSSKGTTHTLDGMMLERAEWVEKLESENELLVNMVQEVKDCKIRFLDAVATVDEERNAYRAREVDNSDSKLESFLENGMLSESKRILLPTYMRADAQNVHSQLSKLATQIRANQLEILQATLNQVKQAEEAFIDQRYEDVDDSMEKLRNLASAAPGNIYAAESLMNNIVGTLQQVIPQTLPTSKVNNSEEEEQKKIAEDNKKSKSMTVMERLQQKSERNRSEMKKFGRGGSRNTAQAAAKSRVLAPDNTSSSVDIRRFSQEATVSDDVKALDDSVRNIMNKTILTYMKNVVKAHPLGSELSDDLVETSAEEATLVLGNIVAPFLLTLQVQRLRGDLTADAIEWVPPQVMGFLRSSEGHAEVLTIVMMILTYVHQRTATLDQQQNQEKDKGYSTDRSVGGKKGSDAGASSDRGSETGEPLPLSRRFSSRKSVADTIREKMSINYDTSNKSDSMIQRASYTYTGGSVASSMLNTNSVNGNNNEWSGNGATTTDDTPGLDAIVNMTLDDPGTGVATEYIETLDPGADKRGSSADVNALPRFMQPKGMGRRSVVN